jgi:Bacterial archaeo-eukaryotic release factor family 7
MTNVTLSDLYELVSERSDPCVSILMPTQSSGRDGQQDAVRLRNLGTRAEQQLIERGQRSPLVRDFMEPILELPRDERTWSRRKLGLAVFRSENAFEMFQLDVTLEESVVVDRRFHVKRLLPALNVNPPFFVLVLNRNNVRLLRATWRGCELIRPRNLPVNMAKTLNLQTADRGEQVHTGMRGDLGKEAAVFHGQGGHRDTLKDEIGEFFRLVDEALWPVLRGSEWPVIAAGVDYELAIFREVATHTRLNDESLTGGFDYVTDDELYERALPLARRIVDQEKAKALNTLNDFAHTGRASYKVERIVPAAFQGQVETLFVNPHAAEFGRFHPATNWVEFTTESSPTLDLVEDATEQTILHRGKVYATAAGELPENRSLGAVFRF